MRPFAHGTLFRDNALTDSFVQRYILFFSRVFIFCSFCFIFFVFVCLFVCLFLVFQAAVAIAFSPNNDLLATAHLDDVGVFLWSNRAHFTEVFLRYVLFL
jgi:hypothetical protein